MNERAYIRRNRKPEGGRWAVMLRKGLILLAGCFVLLYLLGQTVEKIARPIQEKQGEFIPLQEAGNLAWLLADTAGQQDLPSASAEALLARLRELDASEGEGYLTWAQAEEILSFFPEGEEGWHGGAYGKRERVLAKDWFAWFDEARKTCDPDGRIRDLELTVLGAGGSVRRSDGTPLEETKAVSKEGEWTLFADRFRQENLRYIPLTAVERDGGLYAVRRVQGGGAELENAWIVEADREGLTCFWNGVEIAVTVPDGGTGDGADRMAELLSECGGSGEQVADLRFEGGYLSEIDCKEEKISGRLLSLRDGGARIEGQGFYPFSEDAKLYRLYGRMQLLDQAELRIGYSFTDFVLEDGEIVAALVSREEKMEKIRVLIRGSGYRNALHDSVSLQPDCACSVLAGETGEETAALAAGDTLTITADSPLFGAGDRIRIQPGIQTGRISLTGVERSQGVPSYRGSLELVKTDGKIAVINEVLLEEYLYAVVPSEMPSGYPLEALKSQAVCARTYAYSKMCRAGLPDYGAHVDDSSGFQVYNNIGETAETTRAVKETKGEVLYYRGEPAQTYYYSTSCGYGTDAGIWGGSGAQSCPYLMAQAINSQNMDLTVRAGQGQEDGAVAVMSAMSDQARILTDEAAFGSFLLEDQPSFYEREEPWYRWTYTVEKLDADVLSAAVAGRYAADPDGVLTLQADGTYRAADPPKLGRILDISVTDRGAGGVANGLLITGEGGAVRIETEHNIRYALCDGSAPVIRQDGSRADASSMLPSAFFTVSTFKENGIVVGYSLSGGGFGHGVGMSQNGAKRMALSGCDSDGILAFFYKGCDLQAVY